MDMTSSINVIRRAMLLTGAAALAPWANVANALPPKTLVFPRDRGSHPDFNTEWWYITGDIAAGARRFGFQLTFFRSRISSTQALTSKFAAKQLMFAHGAVTDVDGQKLHHDQRVARAGFGVATASENDMALKLRDWSLRADGQQYAAQIVGPDFDLQLALNETQSVLLQGAQGLSRKGPHPAQASYYYSQPNLQVVGKLRLEGRAFDVTGRAWLDHEWSNEILAPGVVGWDWIGMNLLDGSALTAFRLRSKAGEAVWDGGSFRSADKALYVFSRGEVIFKPTRQWKSPLTQITYPVEWIVRTPADFYTVKAVIDNQELDSRQSTGSIYWEGLSELFSSNGAKVGSGYLEMTGYGQPLRI